MSVKLLIAAAVTTVLAAGCGATRPPGPPVGAERVLPWGAVAVSPSTSSDSGDLERQLDIGFRRLVKNTLRDEPGEPFTYRSLVLSGGGSRGAFAAGFLEGWSSTGTRPSFALVTGISTGALIATFAFLGSEYDVDLQLYTQITNDDIFRKGNPLRALGAESVHDTTPMRELIAETITQDVIDAVADEHAAGRRLFVATTNLETGRFTVWDLGAIAASDRPGRLDRYRDILLAATAFPVMFPPVYIPVEVEGERYWEAHVDGAARAAVFARAFMLDVEDILEATGKSRDEMRSELYMLYNSQPQRAIYEEVRPRAASIAERTVNSMLDGIGAFSAVALFRTAMWTGTDYYASWIPTVEALSASPLDFEPEEMRRLFSLGREMARGAHPFLMHHPAPRDAEELMRLTDPDDGFEIDVEAYERAAGLL